MTESIGGAKDTEGSEWIISVVDKPDPRPVWITVWGGSADLAQALWKVENERTAAELAAFKSKLRIYAINDQDSTGPWIKQTHPDLFYITAYHAYRGMYRDGDPSLVTRDWVSTNVAGRGPMGRLYPNYDGGDRDTFGDDTTERATVLRWRRAYQNSFAARMSWCTRPRDQANHPPVAAIDGPVARTVTPGTCVELSGGGSKDPDGDTLSFDWSFYREPGSYAGPLTFAGHDQPQASFVAPHVDTLSTIHVVLSVTDSGSPP